MLKRVLAPVAALLAAGAVGGLGAVAAWEAIDEDPAATTTTATVREASPAPARPAADTDAAAAPGSLPAIVDEAMPSVVQITAEGGGLGGGLPRTPEPPLVPPAPGVPGSTGSGWLLDADGHVVTNQHVVAGADTVTVTFHDGSEVRAEVLGADASTDVAVLRLEEVPEGVEPLPLGSSDSLRIAETVLAIGSPFGLQGTVTSGIVSALDRDIRAPDGFTIDGAIQTDAALNHGNSGGPLLDASGRVVGMNAQIASESGGNDGVGYAIPIETVTEIAADLIEDGRVEHAYLGVQITDAEDGAEVVEVVAGGPAAAAGLRQGDVVVRAGGEAVESSDQLRDAVSSRRPGDELELEVRRGDATETLTVELGARPSGTD